VSWWFALIVAPALAEPPASPAEAPLPDLAAQAIVAARGRCERPDARGVTASAVGADQVHVGAFEVGEDGAVVGTERRLLFANSTWRRTPGPDGVVGADCEVVWNVTGHVAAPGHCADCALAFTFEANADYAASTCPMRIVSDGNHFRTAYDVHRSPTGEVRVQFSASGNALGAGHAQGRHYVWASPHRCVWL